MAGWIGVKLLTATVRFFGSDSSMKVMNHRNRPLRFHRELLPFPCKGVRGRKHAHPVRRSPLHRQEEFLCNFIRVAFCRSDGLQVRTSSRIGINGRKP